VAKQAIRTEDLPGVAEARVKQRARRDARKGSDDRLKAIGNKMFKNMTRDEKDELLFRLVLEAGLLPRGTE